MRVITLHKDELEESCRKLESAVRRDFNPDLVIGIREGGARVAELMFSEVRHETASCRRPSTSTKESGQFVGTILRKLPEWMKNGLRIFESFALSLVKNKTRKIELDIEDKTRKLNILVVDDAIDSGITMQTVCRAVENQFPLSHIRSAVLTVTTSKPAVKADYSLYDNLTLIRFPWSKDYQPAK